MLGSTAVHLASNARCPLLVLPRQASDGADAGVTAPQIAPVGAGDLGELLGLMRGYCDFYEVAPSDEALRALAQTLLDHPRPPASSCSHATRMAAPSASPPSTGATRRSRPARSAS